MSDCSICRYAADANDRHGKRGLLECRRRAPSPELLLTREGDHRNVCWPAVLPTDWCGEHMPAPSQPKDTGT